MATSTRGTWGLFNNERELSDQMKEKKNILDEPMYMDELQGVKYRPVQTISTLRTIWSGLTCAPL